MLPEGGAGEFQRHEPLHISWHTRLHEQPEKYAGAWNFGPADQDARPVRFVVESLARHWGVKEPWVEDTTSHPPEERFLQLDVSKAADAAGMVRAAEESFGKLDVLFNNAGIMHSDDDNAITTEEKVWDLTMNINLKGVFLGCKYGIPALRQSGGGSIINVASFVALLGAATPQLAYTASKGGVLAMTRELAVIHARENIRVNAICPGPLRTELLMKFLNTEAKKQRRLVHIPMGRFGEAIEIAKSALFLASDESSFTTGATFTVDGGITAAYVTPE
jgi:NAD(P)-dependent dehydrogenase (short-subunit alcohol dehydrogenase family)